METRKTKPFVTTSPSDLSNSELNERIAELLGISLPETWTDAKGELQIGVRPYCEDIGLAINLVVEKMANLGFSVIMDRAPGAKWTASFHSQMVDADKIRPSLPRAICEAALEAHEQR